MLNKGDKVKMTLDTAKFYLETPQIFFSYSGNVDPSYNDVMMIAMSRVMGVPVIGKVTGKGAYSNTYRVSFNLEDLTYEAYYDYPEGITSVK